jgi:hypothetical protein
MFATVSTAGRFSCCWLLLFLASAASPAAACSRSGSSGITSIASSSFLAAVAGAAAAMLPAAVLSLLQLMFMLPIILRTVCCQMFCSFRGDRGLARKSTAPSWMPAGQQQTAAKPVKQQKHMFDHLLARQQQRNLEKEDAEVHSFALPANNCVYCCTSPTTSNCSSTGKLTAVAYLS